MWQWVFQFIIARETPAMSQNMGWGEFTSSLARRADVGVESLALIRR
jgi:hypothetical protein